MEEKMDRNKTQHVEDKIIRSAMRLFAKNGFYKTDMVKIAQASSLSRFCLYRYFPSKKSIIFAALRKASNRCDTLVFKFRSDMINPNVHVIDQFFEQVQTYLDEYYLYHVALFILDAELWSTKFQQIQSALDDYVGRWNLTFYWLFSCLRDKDQTVYHSEECFELFIKNMQNCFYLPSSVGNSVEHGLLEIKRFCEARLGNNNLSLNNE